MKVLIYLREDELAPCGGPLGVGFYYKEEIKKKNNSDIQFLPTKKINETRNTAKKYVKKLPKSLYRLQHDLREIFFLKKLFRGKIEPALDVDLNDYDIVHFHESKDLFIEKERLKNDKGKIIFQSHTPLPSGMEKCSDYSNLYNFFINNLENKMLEVDKFAFYRADYIIFPCPEAEEPYIDNWSEYKKIKEKKALSFRYVLTGIKPCHAKRSQSDVRGELNIPLFNFIISYVGRHNYVKGYDTFKKIGLRLINENKNNWVVVAGRPGVINSPKNNHWIEIGWTNDAYSYIISSDLFVLPNRVTYFDLVMLEVLSLGVVVVASRTGGNKFFEKEKVPGVFLYDTEDEAVFLINKIKNMSLKERETLGIRNKEFFFEHLTVDCMYNQYIKLLDQIYRDCNA